MGIENQGGGGDGWYANDTTAMWAQPTRIPNKGKQMD